MRKVLSSKEMAEVDRLSTEKYGIPQILLMENAAHAASRCIVEKLGGSVEDRSILVLCGLGNNGGDGAALARILWQQGADVEVCLFGTVAETSGEARINFEILNKIADHEGFELSQSDLAFEEIRSLDDWLEYDSLNFHCDDPDVIVDALFGTGLKRPLEDIHQQVAAYIDAYAGDEGDSATLVVSLDLPSGLNADSGEPIGIHPRSDVTITFTAPKLANVLPPASDANGELNIASIGSPLELVERSSSQTFVAEASDAADWLCKTEFSKNSYKNKRGHALIVAGSPNYSGAAVLCADAAVRSGAGLVTVAVPEGVRDSVAARVSPEVMVRGLASSPRGAVVEKSYQEIESLVPEIDVIAIGSGLTSTEAGTKKLVRNVVDNRTTPVILDADALNVLSPFKIRDDGPLYPLILTPHEGEFRRLRGVKKGDKIEDRVKAVRDFAVEHGVILVLKGQRVLVGSPDGQVVIVPTGNPGLGKGGNGDTLTGLIAGFTAQAAVRHVNLFETVVAAVYLAGLAGDIADRKFGRRVMTASDTRECFADAVDIVQTAPAAGFSTE